MLSILFTILCVVIALIAIVIAVKVFLVLLPFLLIGAAIFLVVKCDSDDFSFLKDTIEKTERNVRNESFIYRERDGEERIAHRIARDITIAKAGVNMSSLRPEIDSAIVVIVEAFQDAMEDDSFLPVITSANDFSAHAKNSAHYAGAAVDLRIKDIGNLKARKELAADVRERLGDRFYVLHEDIGSSNEHLHVQLRSGTYNARERWQ
ncbi:hypothetical protein [Fibrobacter intestinalis]|uniref:Peptidase M15 n=1 Tax=Fibrobacter intestinalis TaxID=28122 RepID=A0A1T4RWK0_9BACT|nr:MULTISPECIES: hypothetical protein [Fibrobacter]PBC72847.1 hypothetical protein BGW94_0427 [Fibrobacter sp. NR9]SKA20342.1 hypothetical protein SAMN02745108_02885 [Fibrobacter intestinalis]